MFPLRSLPVHVASAGGGEVLFNRFCQTGQAVRVFGWSVRLSVCSPGWQAGRARQGTAQASDCRSPQADRRAKLLQPGQGRLRLVDDDDVQERGRRRGRSRRSDADDVLTGPGSNEARIGNKGEMMLMKQ